MFNPEKIKLLHSKENNKSEIHEKIGISKSNYSNIMNENVSPTVETIEKIAKFFKKPVGYFFDEPDANDLQEKVKELELDKIDILNSYSIYFKKKEDDAGKIEHFENELKKVYKIMEVEINRLEKENEKLSTLQEKIDLLNLLIIEKDKRIEDKDEIIRKQLQVLESYEHGNIVSQKKEQHAGGYA